MTTVEARRFAIVLEHRLAGRFYWTGRADALGQPERTQILASAKDYGSRDEARLAAETAGIASFGVMSFTLTTEAA